MKRRLGAALAGAVILVSCGVTGTDSLNLCQESFPAPCGSIAHCVLASNEYLQSTFPGSQIFVVRTTSPTRVTFSFEFTNRISAGTMLTLTSSEPDCSERSVYTSTSDIFMLAGASGVLSFPITMTEPGDHLIQFNSDAYCSYQLVYQ
jgi:hypothetical protein